MSTFNRYTWSEYPRSIVAMLSTIQKGYDEAGIFSTSQYVFITSDPNEYCGGTKDSTSALVYGPSIIQNVLTLTKHHQEHKKKKPNKYIPTSQGITHFVNNNIYNENT
jgi:hypothetical protein